MLVMKLHLRTLSRATHCVMTPCCVSAAFFTSV